MLNVLFCYSRYSSFTNAVGDYARAFGEYSEHRIHYFDMDSGPFDFDLRPFDCIIFNYCFWARFLPSTPSFLQRVAGFTGLKIAIFQDEYDSFLWHEDAVIAMGIKTIITCVPEEHWRDVFRSEAFDHVEFMNALTGYVPENLLHLPQPRPLASRQWAIGYRGRPVPFFYGRLTMEKFLIGQRMKELCSERGITENIELSEASRLYGPAWPEFIGNCRTVLGTESGSNVFDFNGTLKLDIEAYLKAHPDADFESVHDRFLKEHDGKIRMNQVSPRIFEAIAMRTGLVLFEGEYSGVIRPWEHFIPLKKDFSNFNEVIAAIDDLPGLASMVERAYEEVIASGKYHFRTFIQRIDAHISARVPEGQGVEPYYGLIAWRVSSNAPLEGVSGQNSRVPTDRPLCHFDKPSDPFIKFQCDPGALRRSLVWRYELILYSSTGRWLKERFQKNQIVYSALRKFIHLLTGRRDKRPDGK